MFGSMYRGGIPCRNAELKYVSFWVLVWSLSQYIPLVAVHIFTTASSLSFLLLPMDDIMLSRGICFIIE